MWPTTKLFENYCLTFECLKTWSRKFLSTSLLWNYIIDSPCTFPLTKSLFEVKTFFPAAVIKKLRNIRFYSCLRYWSLYLITLSEKNLCQQKSLHNFEKIHDGVYDHMYMMVYMIKFCDSSFSQSEVKVEGRERGGGGQTLTCSNFSWVRSFFHSLGCFTLLSKKSCFKILCNSDVQTPAVVKA